MRLLFDRNLSHKLKTTLSDLYPESLHVNDLALDEAADTAIWAWAGAHGLVVATKDADYRELSRARGHPPKVIWIRSGNCPTSEVSALLCAHYDELLTFYADERRGLIALG